MRALPYINAAGCAILAACIFFQWTSGRNMEGKLKSANQQVAQETSARVDAEKKNQRLEADVEGLKAAIDSIRKESESAAATLTTQTGQADAIAKNLTQTQEQLKAWEEAVKARDAKISELNAHLLATRKRLDEALAALKKAGAR